MCSGIRDPVSGSAAKAAVGSGGLPSTHGPGLRGRPQSRRTHGGGGTLPCAAPVWVPRDAGGNRPPAPDPWSALLRGVARAPVGLGWNLQMRPRETRAPSGGSAFLSCCTAMHAPPQYKQNYWKVQASLCSRGASLRNRRPRAVAAFPGTPQAQPARGRGLVLARLSAAHLGHTEGEGRGPPHTHSMPVPFFPQPHPGLCSGRFWGPVPSRSIL